MKISDLKKEDYNPYYATYIAYLKEEDLKKALKDDLVFFRNFMGNMEADKLNVFFNIEPFVSQGMIKHRFRVLIKMNMWSMPMLILEI